jgi:RimJ/RimL family protein N-acetyltransferase
MALNIFSDQPMLENSRVILRPLQDSDTDHLLPFSLQEPELWTYGLVTAAGRSNLEKYIQTAVKAREEQKEFPFIVFDKQSGRYAGSTRFYDIHQDWLTTQLGYTWYGKEFQQSGLNRHCKLLLLTYVFEKWGLERCEFRADANNARSIAAMKAIGCVEEGILRNHMPTSSGGRRDSIILSILKTEWVSGVKLMLQSKTN